MESNKQEKPAKPADDDAKVSLNQLAEKAKTQRFSPAEEEQAKALLKTEFAGGKKTLSSAISAAISLPWIISTHAITGVWPDLKPLAQKSLLAALAKETSDPARRTRLSLARAFLKIDPALSAKLAGALCVEMLANSESADSQNPEKPVEPGKPEKAETPALALKDRQLFYNVMIGQGKPWMLHLPLDDLKKAESAALVRCALAACFEGKTAPFTQLSLIQWLAANDDLAELPAKTISLMANSVEKWNSRWKKELEKVESLPAPLLETAQKPTKSESPKTSAPDRKPEKETASEKPTQKNQPSENSRSRKKAGPDSPQKSSAPERPSQTHQNLPRERSAPAHFHLPATLKQIESHFKTLQDDLQKARAEIQNLKSRDRRQPMRKTEVAPGENFDAEELRRHNSQLESTVADLRQQLEELAANSEDEAFSRQAGGEAEQFKTLLGIKLRDQFEEFEAMKREAADEVFREHYRDMLDSIFQLLEKQGVPLR